MVPAMGLWILLCVAVWSSPRPQTSAADPLSEACWDIVFIADTGNHWVFGITRDGAIVWSVGRRGKIGQVSEGLLGSPGFVQVWQRHSIVVGDSAQGVIVEYSLENREPLQVMDLRSSECLGSALPEVRSAFKVGENRFLYADHSLHWVAELSQNPSATALSQQCTTLEVIWHFGAKGTAGTHDHLFSPAWAAPLDTGNVLIADSLNGRVLEVDRNGNTVRQHGREAMEPGGLKLVEPLAVEALEGGDYLICDTGQSRVIQVDGSGHITWELNGVKIGDQAVPLVEPAHASRLPNGNTLITDSRLEDVYEVTGDGTVVWSYQGLLASCSDLKPLSSPAMAIAIAGLQTAVWGSTSAQTTFGGAR